MCRDDNIGSVLGALEAGGLARNTIVALWGDHGWSLGEHGLWDKHTNFDIDTHAPVMFRVPGLTDGGVTTEQAASALTPISRTCRASHRTPRQRPARPSPRPSRTARAAAAACGLVDCQPLPGRYLGVTWPSPARYLAAT